MTAPDAGPLLDALTRWQAERDLTNAAMAERVGMSEAYWKSLKIGRRPVTLAFARQVYHRFTTEADLVLRLLAKRFIDQWFGSDPERERTVGGEQ